MKDKTPQKIVPELGVSDFQNSLNFYTSILGFSVMYERPEEGFAYLEFEGAELMIDVLNMGRSFLNAPMEHPFGRGMNLQIQTANVEALYKKVQNAACNIFLDLEEKWYRKGDVQVGNKQFVVSDPDGYLLRFYEDMGEKAYVRS